MTNDEIMKTMDDLCDEGKSWVEVVGDNAEELAKLVAKEYETEARGPIVISNQRLADEICYSEESIEHACEMMRANGIAIWPDNFEF